MYAVLANRACLCENDYSHAQARVNLVSTAK